MSTIDERGNEAGINYRVRRIDENGTVLWYTRSVPEWTTGEDGQPRRGFWGSRHKKWLREQVDLGFFGKDAEAVRCRKLSREESRARAEARGEVRALEAVGVMLAPRRWAQVEHEKLLTDARTRAGLRDGGRR